MGDVNAVMRVHAFLEKYGIINFTQFGPQAVQEKPHNMFVMQETTFDKVHVNLANKASFKKNEGDFLNNFALVKDGKEIAKATPK